METIFLLAEINEKAWKGKKKKWGSKIHKKVVD